MKPKPKSPEWVRVGGAPGELAWCERCGDSLKLNLPQPVLVMTGAMEGFARHHADCPPGRYTEPKIRSVEEWLKSRDTGISSRTICHVMTGGTPPADSFGFSVPWDPDDFGRCHRLLERFPEWRTRMPEVAARFPMWGPLVREWDRLTALFVEESPRETCPKLYAAMKRLLTEGGAV